MNVASLFLSILYISLSFLASSAKATDIYQKETFPEIKSEFDHFLEKFWIKNKVSCAKEASDNVLVRRLYVDLLGRVPLPQETLSYVNSKTPNKWNNLVVQLLSSEEHAQFWTLRMGDELRIKSEFPINLWPNATFLYSHEIKESLRKNEPYDQWAKRLLLSEGSNFRSGLVNFYRAVPEKDASHLAEAFSQFFLNQDFRTLPDELKKDLVKVFSDIRYKKTHEWKEEVVYEEKKDEEQKNKGQIKTREDLVAWLTSTENPYFAKTAVERYSRWLFGKMTIHPEIARYLTQYFQKSGYNIQELITEICTSALYRSSSFKEGDRKQGLEMNAVYPIRRLDAEVIADSIAQIVGVPYHYSSVIPEPFSFYTGRSIQIFDGSVTSQFLMLLGKPSRDTGLPDERKNEITAKQRLYLYNSSDLFQKIQGLQQKLNLKTGKIDELYMLFYSRYPTTEERQIFAKLSRQKKMKKNFVDLAWILLNSKEFLYQH